LTSEATDVGETTVKVHSHQARLRPSRDVRSRTSMRVDGRRLAWCEWALTHFVQCHSKISHDIAYLHYFAKFDRFSGRLCHSGWRQTYKVRCRISSFGYAKVVP